MSEKVEGNLHLRADGSERLVYNSPDFPVRTVQSTLGIFFDYAAACHWHRDFEILLMQEGEMDYFVNGTIVHLRPGEAIFVNARRLHYGFSPEKRDCVYRLIVFDPELLGDYAPVARAVDELCDDASPDFFHLRGANATEARMLQLIADSLSLGREGRFLALLSVCAELAECACKLLLTGSIHGPHDESWSLLRRMTGYIQLHYQERILLENIASAAAICRSRCCKLFKEKLGCTPGEYMTNYRLNKACGMMAQGKSITDAALTCGFNGTSYFAETFRKAYGISPRMYRERCRNQAGSP